MRPHDTNVILESVRYPDSHSSGEMQLCIRVYAASRNTVPMDIVNRKPFIATIPSSNVCIMKVWYDGKQYTVRFTVKKKWHIILEP